MGQPWPQSTTSLQSQDEHPLTLTAPFPAGISSSDEESSSSLLSALTAEFVTRERLAAAQERPKEIRTDPLTSKQPPACRRAPAGRAASHPHTCPNTTAAALATGRCPAPAPPPSPHGQDKTPARICTFPGAGLQQMTLSQNISDTGFFVRLHKPMPPTSAVPELTRPTKKSPSLTRESGDPLLDLLEGAPQWAVLDSQGFTQATTPIPSLPNES